MIVGWSLEQPVSEQQFLRRELGITWQVAEVEELRQRCRQATATQPLLLICSEPAGYRELIDQAAANSLVLIMLSDEAYDPERLDLVRDAPALRAIYRHYTLTLANPLSITWQAIVLTTQAIGTSIRPTAVLDLLRTGRATRARMRAWRELGTAVHVMPLGYTNRFADEFCSHLAHRGVELGAETSLLTHASAGDARRWRMVFRGAGGQPQRQIMLMRAARQHGVLIEVLGEGWSGFNHEGAGAPASAAPGARESYVEQLLQADAALCPPGFINLETFRAYEALICGARPIEPRIALTHGGRRVCSRSVSEVAHLVMRLRGELARDCGASSLPAST